MSSFFFFSCSVDLRDLHSFPTRRSSDLASHEMLEVMKRCQDANGMRRSLPGMTIANKTGALDALRSEVGIAWRSEEHTSELQSQFHLVCRLLLEKKKKTKYTKHHV